MVGTRRHAQSTHGAAAACGRAAGGGETGHYLHNCWRDMRPRQLRRRKEAQEGGEHSERHKSHIATPLRPDAMADDAADEVAKLAVDGEAGDKGAPKKARAPAARSVRAMCHSTALLRHAARAARARGSAARRAERVWRHVRAGCARIRHRDARPLCATRAAPCARQP